MAKKNPAPSAARDDQGWSDPLPKPVIVDGFARFSEGFEIEGVVMAIGTSDYGTYLAIKAKGATEVVKEGEKETLPAGSIIGLSVTAALRPVVEIARKGPTAVRIRCNGKDGNAWDLTVQTRDAF